MRAYKFSFSASSSLFLFLLFYRISSRSVPNNPFSTACRRVRLTVEAARSFYRATHYSVFCLVSHGVNIWSTDLRAINLIRSLSSFFGAELGGCENWVRHIPLLFADARWAVRLGINHDCIHSFTWTWGILISCLLNYGNGRSRWGWGRHGTNSMVAANGEEGDGVRIGGTIVVVDIPCLHEIPHPKHRLFQFIHQQLYVQLASPS